MVVVNNIVLIGEIIYKFTVRECKFPIKVVRKTVDGMVVDPIVGMANDGFELSNLLLGQFDRGRRNGDGKLFGGLGINPDRSCLRSVSDHGAADDNKRTYQKQQKC